MKPYPYSLLTLAIIAVSYSDQAMANLQQQCLRVIPQFAGQPTFIHNAQLPVYIEADQAVINQKNEAIYTGKVEIKQGNRFVTADEVRLIQEADRRDAYFIGDFDYQDHLISAKGTQATINLLNKDAELFKIDYQLVGRPGRGSANSVSVRNDKRIMYDASFTSCLPNDKSWVIQASEMVQHVKAEYAELWHARFKVFGVPIFYSPYLQFPIGDRRRSGVLMPSGINYSERDGYAYSQPFYWNIAPNLDATLTSTYYTRRGWKWSPEFRYLTRLGEGKMAAEYLHRDGLPSWTEKQQHRYLLFWQHNISFATNWRFAVDYTRVSDSRYFSEMNSMYGNSTDGYATQNVKLGYYRANYNLSIAAKKFQTFDTSGSRPYRTFPQIDFNFYQNNLVKNGDFAFFSQLAHFANDSKQMPTAWRLHLQPSMHFPFANRFGSLSLETKLYATYYWQKKAKAENALPVVSRIRRILPQFKVDLKTTLQSPSSMFKGITQILEPRVQYLYRPYRDQNNIGAANASQLGLGYDSVLLQQDYLSLFNDRRYSGLDRIASANQITLGGTTHFFDDQTGRELFNLSMGQIYYIRPSKIDDRIHHSTSGNASSWVLESDWKFHRNWNWHGSYQYDTRLRETALANSSLQFKPTPDNVIQLNYRYASRDYIDQNLSANHYGQDIKQLGAVIGWELTDNIAIMGSHYRDLALKKPVETQFGVNYNTCCWSANIYAARHLVGAPAGKPDKLQNVYYENKFGLNFDLRLGNHYHNGIARMLNKGIIPYTEAFNISE